MITGDTVRLRALGLALAILAASTTGLSIGTDNAEGYSVHDPIWIYGDDGFNATNGVTGGTGIPSDPYIIEGWQIGAYNSIYIRDTNATFVIRDCYINSGGPGIGIYFVRVRNASVEDVVIEGTDEGTLFIESEGIGIRNCILSGNGYGSAVNSPGIGIYLSSEVTVLENAITSFYNGVHVSMADEVDILDCSIQFAVNLGINLDECSNGTLADNSCVFSDGGGIGLYSSSNSTLSGNNCSSNGDYGVYLSSSTGTTAYHNVFFDNVDGNAYDDRGSENLWNTSYPLGGNYWDNYTGVDEYSGPNQGQPGPDGIGDTPYKIDEDSFDYYPLMAPSVTPPTASFTVSPSTGYVNTVFSVDASSCSDAEDDLSELEIRWDWESDGDWDTSWTVVKTDTHQYPVEGTHTITLEVRDTLGLVNDTARQVTVIADDVPPMADAGPDQTVDAGALDTFDGSGSSDNIGIVNYTWTFVDGTGKELYGVSPTYTFDDPGEYTVTLDVADDADNHDTDTVVITVLEANDPPVADAGTDQTVNVGEAITFDGSGSSDDVGIENYTWTFTYNDEAREIYGVGPTFTFEIAGTYTVTLTVMDAEGETDTDTVTITVEEEEEEPEEDGKSFLESYGLPLGIVIALAVIALVLFFVLRGRKGGKAPTGLEEPPSTGPESQD